MRLNVTEIIKKLMQEDSYKNLSMDELTKIFSRKKSEQEEIKRLLMGMVEQGVVIRDRKNKYGLAERNGYRKGIISMNSKGFGFISDEQGDVFIAPPDTHYALHEDEVLYKITKPAGENLRAEGYVKAVLKRNTDIIVGRFVKNKNFAFVVPDDRRIQYDIFIPKKLFNQAKHGDIVSCKIIKYPAQGKKPEGMVTGIIGKERNLFVDIQSEIVRRKIPEDFSIKVKKQVAKLPDGISEEERNRRESFKDKLIYTIDGADSKDLDDAISVERLANGNYLLGVYIADVSHYVPENSAPDKEALERGTSIYFADRVIPMLPERLSNDLCSLNPNEDKLVLALLMEFDKKAKLISHQVSEGIISSSYRLVYEDVSDYLENQSGILTQESEALLESLDTAKELALLLRKKREKRGGIDFSFPETQFTLDGERVIDVKNRSIRIANEMIEDFMIAANETIAEQHFLQEVPFLYRVHDVPDIEKLANVFQQLEVLNIKYKKHRDGKIYSKDIQDIMEQVRDLPQKDMIHYALLRSMQKAKYSPKNTSHFGLASNYYTHFTSPIRRYPDLQIHRIIKEIVGGRFNMTRYNHYEKILQNIAEKTSSAEMRAIDLERTVDDILACYYMDNHIGEVFKGKIVNFTSFGIFILLENTIEGLIRYSSIVQGQDIPYFNETATTEELIKKQYRIGDEVSVIVEGVDFLFREVVLSFE
ncbi:MAG: ribonuclease R [Peptostreptococcaceae bacterium]|nr:ribonuclease R [Peptostreptococcaceae bacterium]